MKTIDVLRRVDRFLTNGIALGYIRMPDDDCPDPAKEVPGLVKAAIAEYANDIPYAGLLQSALRFYADPSNYSVPNNANPVRRIFSDCGATARAALAKTSPEIVSVDPAQITPLCLRCIKPVADGAGRLTPEGMVHTTCGILCECRATCGDERIPTNATCKGLPVLAVGNPALASRLREAVTVLDEPFHREAVAATLEAAAAVLDGLPSQGKREPPDGPMVLRNLCREQWEVLGELRSLWPELRQLVDGFMNGDPRFTTWDHSVRDRMIELSFRLDATGANPVLAQSNPTDGKLT